MFPTNAGVFKISNNQSILSSKKNTRKIAAKTDNHNTFNGWSTAKTDAVIDYIYVSGFSSCPQYKTVTEKYAEKPFVSDHYPIFARLVF